MGGTKVDEEPEDYLVPGRNCGSCTSCCKDLLIETSEIQKPCGVSCSHSSTGNCDIYATRPDVCRSFHCLWRRMPTLDESWRPNESGILMIPFEVPPGYAFAVNLVMVGDAEAITRDRFAGLVGGFIDSGTATFLDLPGGPGMLGRNTMLNPALQAAVSARDLASVKAGILNCYEILKAYEPVPAPIFPQAGNPGRAA